MFRPLQLLILAVALCTATGAAPVAAQKGDFVPKPDTYLCPNAPTPGAVDCFLNAVEHLYTMCRQVKTCLWPGSTPAAKVPGSQAKDNGIGRPV